MKTISNSDYNNILKCLKCFGDMDVRYYPLTTKNAQRVAKMLLKKHSHKEANQ